MLEICSALRLTCMAILMCMLSSRCEAENSRQTGIEVSSRLISSVCALHSKFQDDKIMADEPLKSVPQGLPVLDTNCDTWVRNFGEVCETWSFEKESKCKYKKERGARVIGGEDAKLGDAPWDVHLRNIYDWGSTMGSPNKFTKEEIATNNVSRIKEWSRCTGFFYTKDVVVTTGVCGEIGSFYALTRSRFVAWLARQRFLLQNWCILKSDVNPKKTCDILWHPNYTSPFKGKAMMKKYMEQGTNGISYTTKEHDLSLIKFYTPFNFKNLPHTKAVLFAQPGMEFEGKAIFAGWGITNDSFSDEDIVTGHPSRLIPASPTKLQKIGLTILPFEPKCKTLLLKFFNLGVGVFDPNYDYSQRYICAEPVDGTKQGLCLGDHGGALVCDKDGKKYVCGVKTIWGAYFECVKDGDGIEMFMKMSYYTTWIESVVGKQSDSDLNP